ncbi:hypothetical protein Thiowin_04686 [Thiorhodovibrio winogradskyi]|uniref:Uncharacterized protein n=1 Tax=Thiorhodovibrio winogradskyi TaxID=77007 RepID=A0ABZ0SEQ7_9GAMM|nr:hypothetical protein [Thiorhodovibrio winogradskyi]
MPAETEPSLLPNEPRVLDVPRQQALTERYLLPARNQLDALFRDLRARLDPRLSQAQPSKWGKPYPLGQCLELSLAVKRALRQLDPRHLSGAAAQGHAALASFLQQGGQMHQVWGDLRGNYFQNAFLAGTLYIDVANDSVDASKPPVEILPLSEARLMPLQDFQHFARIASRYWQAELHPNHLLPALAPYYPFVACIPGCGIRLEADSGYMVLLAQRQCFRSSQRILEAVPLDAGLFHRLKPALAHTPLELAGDPIAGRTAALTACRNFAKADVLSDARRAALGAAIAEVNRCWARLEAARAAREGANEPRC